MMIESKKTKDSPVNSNNSVPAKSVKKKLEFFDYKTLLNYGISQGFDSESFRKYIFCDPQKDNSFKDEKSLRKITNSIYANVNLRYYEACHYDKITGNKTLYLHNIENHTVLFVCHKLFIHMKVRFWQQLNFAREKTGFWQEINPTLIKIPFIEQKNHIHEFEQQVTALFTKAPQEPQCIYKIIPLVDEYLNSVEVAISWMKSELFEFERLRFNNDAGSS